MAIGSNLILGVWRELWDSSEWHLLKPNNRRCEERSDEAISKCLILSKKIASLRSQ
jgi:hypothetical protein